MCQRGSSPSPARHSSTVDQRTPAGLAVLEGVVETGVVEGAGGLGDQEAQQLEALAGEAVAGQTVLEHERADAAVLLDDRHAQQRAQLLAADVGIDDLAYAANAAVPTVERGTELRGGAGRRGAGRATAARARRGARARVADRALKVSASAEALLRDRWSRDVAALARELSTITAVDGRARVDVDAARVIEFLYSPTRVAAEQLASAHGRSVTEGERRLVLRESLEASS